MGVIEACLLEVCGSSWWWLGGFWLGVGLEEEAWLSMRLRVAAESTYSLGEAEIMCLDYKWRNTVTYSHCFLVVVGFNLRTPAKHGTSQPLNPTIHMDDSIGPLYFNIRHCIEDILLIIPDCKSDTGCDPHNSYTNGARLGNPAVTLGESGI